jgi:hypothetical protein
MHLAQLEGSLGHTDAAIAHLQQAELASPDSSDLKKMIEELKSKRRE